MQWVKRMGTEILERADLGPQLSQVSTFVRAHWRCVGQVLGLLWPVLEMRRTGVGTSLSVLELRRTGVGTPLSVLEHHRTSAGTLRSVWESCETVIRNAMAALPTDGRQSRHL